MKLLLKAAACALAVAAFVPATASAQAFYSTFETVPGGPTGDGQYTFPTTADGWTANPGGFIELQQRTAGDPSTGSGQFNGGNVFVELDSRDGNSSMSRTITTAGVYALSFIYSPRPGQASTTNGIEVLLNGSLLSPPGTVTSAGGGNTSWSLFSNTGFAVAAGSVLTFRAVGTSDTFGGYVDNISFSAVPEPASWAMMIGGFGLIGGAMRRRRTTATLATA